jgi:hypothetical protein
MLRNETIQPFNVTPQESQIFKQKSQCKLNLITFQTINSERYANRIKFQNQTAKHTHS